MATSPISVAAFLLVATAAASAVAEHTTIYVSPTGSDDNDGSSPGSPLLTLAAAQAKARQQPKTHQVNVELAGGKYNLNDTAVFTEQDLASDG